ncbi:uncharacterized protein C2orf80-like [Trichomycterus rosablanca]|uniref:uncharacterized protein C2orf80-like n=1 Tax=Trichomycterus rosablanca TaxID=2290929 RepID=UPI002F35348E
METKRLRREVKVLLGQYVGQKLRENGFDPKGTGSSSVLDDLAHYDLAINVALWWLEKNDFPFKNELLGATSLGQSQCPNRMEREAIILSSFAGTLLNSLPVDEILSLYSCKPSATCLHPDTKSNIVHPFFLSYHPFAMLSSFKAVNQSKKHTQMLKRNTLHNKARSSELKKSKACSEASSSQSFFGDSEDSLNEQTKLYDSSQESQQD